MFGGYRPRYLSLNSTETILKTSAYLLLLSGLVALAPFATAQIAPTKPLTIEAIFAEGGISGRAPENTKWSPTERNFHSSSATTPAITASSGMSTSLQERRRFS